MEVARSKEGIVINQRKYILDLLSETGMKGCKPAETPIEANLKLRRKELGSPVNKEQYQRLVAKLIYLSLTRPDIVFPVSIDLSWASELTDRRSTTGYCSFVWGNLVTWRSKKQAVVSRSSAEA
ncbi:uncharacterized mitochondrial protein AtMg00810-like [Hibiscus syriacus]|uniref:uncharacterized mitochondrial protein AtMg00810-like n=1 Tax=Hibiscus syriacus TaxID=106335 RepID=UPI0019207142|nr:uncharacterized mitochondrial protein AtMg00810-like [Hibiscus syriacus]